MVPVMAIVKISDISKFGNSLARSIRSNLSWSKQLRGAVKLHVPKNNGGDVSITITVGEGKVDKSGMPLVGMARAYEFGSGLHGKRARKYVIPPRLKKYLMFSSTEGGKGLHGGVIKVKKVMHPGVQPREYIQKSINSVRQRAVDDLKISIRKNVIKDLKLTLRKLK